jgi:hypothetical protein
MASAQGPAVVTSSQELWAFELARRHQAQRADTTSPGPYPLSEVQHHDGHSVTAAAGAGAWGLLCFQHVQSIDAQHRGCCARI